MPAPAYRSHTATVEAHPSISIDKPAGVVDGDLLLAAIAMYQPEATTDVTSVPAGWTLLHTLSTYSDRNQRFSVYWKIAAGEPGSWTFGTNNPASHACLGACVAVSDAGGVAGSSGHTDTGLSTSHPADPVTAGSADDLLVYLAASRRGVIGGAAVWTPPAGFTERYELRRNRCGQQHDRLH